MLSGGIGATGESHGLLSEPTQGDQHAAQVSY